MIFMDSQTFSDITELSLVHQICAIANTSGKHEESGWMGWLFLVQTDHTLPIIEIVILHKPSKEDLPD
jgi:hypothetical protein